MTAVQLSRLASLATGTRPHSVVYAGDPLGVGRAGVEIREDVDVVVVSVDRVDDGWLVEYREVRIRPELSPAS